MSPGKKAQCVLTQEGSENKNQPTASADKNLQKMKRKFNFLDTKGFIRIWLCFTLEEALLSHWFGALVHPACLAGDGYAASAGCRVR